jgi:predicted component of type VI protein secretion system
MNLVLQATALNDEPMSQPLTGRFDARGGTLGRSDSATFTLPDPERAISRMQAQVVYVDDAYWIENISAASPILHNGRTLSSGMRILLRAGDELRVGDYTLQVTLNDDDASETILRGRSMVMRVGAGRMPIKEPPPRAAGSGAAAAPGADAAALWRGFLEGAGADGGSVAAPSPENMAAIGAMLRAAVEGLHSLLEMRAAAKDQMQADLTVIQAGGNNPLKFAPDAGLALHLLLNPPARGFMDGPAAMAATLIDLQSHEVGVMAGMRAALEAVLDRFAPEKLEAQLTTRSVFDSLLPAHRRARLWETYLEHFASLREEAQQDFQRLFGAAFREAYEAQVRSLSASASDE